MIQSLDNQENGSSTYMQCRIKLTNIMCSKMYIMIMFYEEFVRALAGYNHRKVSIGTTWQVVGFLK